MKAFCAIIYLIFLVVFFFWGLSLLNTNFWYSVFPLISSCYSIFCSVTGWEKEEAGHKNTLKQSEKYYASSSFVFLYLISVGMFAGIGSALYLIIFTNYFVVKTIVSFGTKYKTKIEEEMAGYKLSTLIFRFGQYMILWIRISVNFLAGHMLLTVSTSAVFYALALSWLLVPLKLLSAIVQSYIYTYLVSTYHQEMYLGH